MVSGAEQKTGQGTACLPEGVMSRLTNGDRLIFYTSPQVVAMVVGVLEEGYALLFPKKRIQDTEVKLLRFDQCEQALQEGLISRVGDPPPPAKTGRVKTSKPSGKRTVVPPWAKKR